MLGYQSEVTSEVVGFDATCSTGRELPPRILTTVPLVDNAVIPIIEKYYNSNANELYILTKAAFKVARDWIEGTNTTNVLIASFQANWTLSEAQIQDLTNQAIHDRDRRYVRLSRTKTILEEALRNNVANCYRLAQEKLHWWEYHAKVLQSAIAKKTTEGCSACRLNRTQYAYNRVQTVVDRLTLLPQAICDPTKEWANLIIVNAFHPSVSLDLLGLLQDSLDQIKAARDAAIQQDLTALASQIQSDVVNRLSSLDVCINEMTRARDNVTADYTLVKYQAKLSAMQNGRDLLVAWQNDIPTAISEARTKFAALESIQVNQVENSANCYVIRSYPIYFMNDYALTSGMHHVLRSMDHPGVYHMGLLQYMAEASVLRFQDFIRTFRTIHGWINGFVARQVQSGQLSEESGRNRLVDLRAFMQRSYYYINRREFHRRVFIRDRCKRRFIRHARPLYRAIRVYQERYTILVDMREKALANGQYFKAVEATTLLPALIFQRRIYLRVLRRLIHLKQDVCMRFLNLRTDSQLSENIRARQEKRERFRVSWTLHKAKHLAFEMRSTLNRNRNGTFDAVVAAHEQLLISSGAIDRQIAITHMQQTRASHEAVVAAKEELESSISLMYQGLYQELMKFMLDLRMTAERLICPRLGCSYIPWARLSPPISFKSPYPFLGALAAKQLQNTTQFNFNIVLRRVRYSALYSRLQYLDTLDQLDATKANLTSSIQSNPDGLPNVDVVAQVTAMERDIEFARSKELHLWNVRKVDLQSKLQKYVTYQMRKEDTLRRRLRVGRETLAQPSPAPNSSAERALARIDQRVQASQAYTDTLGAFASSLFSMITAPFTRSEIVSTLQQLNATDNLYLYEFDTVLANTFSQAINETMSKVGNYQSELARQVEVLTALNNPDFQTALTDLETALDAEDVRVATVRSIYESEAIRLRQSLLDQLSRLQEESVWQARFWVDQLNMRVQYMVYLITRGLNFNPDVGLLSAFEEGPIRALTSIQLLVPASTTHCRLTSAQSTCSTFRVCPGGMCCSAQGVCGTSDAHCLSGKFSIFSSILCNSICSTCPCAVLQWTANQY
jgi:hypothetical protein